MPGKKNSSPIKLSDVAVFSLFKMSAVLCPNPLLLIARNKIEAKYRPR